MAEDMVRIKYGVSMTSISGSKREYIHEIPRSEWEAMSIQERETLLNDLSETMLGNEVDLWAYVDEEGRGDA